MAPQSAILPVRGALSFFGPHGGHGKWQFRHAGLYCAMLATSPHRHPAVPLAPILSLSSFGGLAGRPPATVLDAGAVRLVTSGRVAIALALRELGVGPGDRVLLPAYHSASMVPPVLWRGATPQFYRVGADARADLDDIAARIGAHTRVLVVTHFFGFPQPLVELRALCDARGIALLEDCAHAFIGEYQGRPLGAWGDYAAASTMKFLPLYDGGALVSARRTLDGVALRPAGVGFELKAALNALERGFDFGRLGALNAVLWLPLRAGAVAAKLLKRRRGSTAQLAPASSDSGYDFDPHWVDKRASLFSRSVLRLSSPTLVAARRRANYRRLAEALAGLPGVRPLHAQLPEGVCPWVFPLVAQDPDRLAARLLEAGVPLTRFGRPLWSGDEGDLEDGRICANAAWLSRHVLGLPCHQELREEEFGWLAATAQRVISAGGGT